MPARLDDEARARALAGLDGWEDGGDVIVRTLEAPDFLTGIRIVDEVAKAAEDMDHHPDIDIRWRRLVFALSTHSAGGVTELDVRLAGRISSIARAHGAH